MLIHFRYARRIRPRSTSCDFSCRFSHLCSYCSSVQASLDAMLIHTPQADGQPLASHFKVLIMDNASIHKDEDYLFHLGTHIKVRFIPPYCYHLSPLDNGAFGLVADFLKQNAADYATQPISVGLDKAFRVYRTGSEAGALAGRMCFHNCKYRFYSL